MAFEGNEGEMISIHLQRLNEEKRATQSQHLMGNILHLYLSLFLYIHKQTGIINSFKISIL